MKLNYHADTDSLYIELCDRPSVDSREISEGVVLDYDAEGRLVGVDVDNAGNEIELQKVLLSKLPGEVETEAARVLSLAVDGSRSWQNVVGILFEASVGGAMLAGRLSPRDTVESR